MKKREEWGTRFGFIMAAVGSAIGLGNIWRFPYQAYDNGGGAFLIPYFFALLTAGIPLLIMEFGLGHKIRRATPAIFARISDKFGLKINMEWLGWWQIFICVVISVYYVVVVAWTISYVYFAFTGQWTADTKGFFFNTYLGISKGPLDFGGLNVAVLIPVALAWIVNWIVLFSGVKKGIELANKIFMPVLIILVFILMFKALTLDGAKEGLNFLFTPDFSKIFNYKVWTAAYGQIFFTLSIGFAIMLTYSSYLPKKSDLTNNAFMTGLLNCGFSMLAGIMIFSILGHMAHVENVPVNKVVGQSIGLAFITLPKALSYMPLPHLFGSLFFLALSIAGFSSFISINEPVVASLMEKYNLTRKKTVTFFTIIGFALSLIFCTNAGLYIVDIVDHFINNFGILLAALVEVFLIILIVKTKYIKEHVNFYSDFKVGKWWDVCLAIVTPFVLIVLASMKFYSAILTPYENYPQKALVLFGWLMVAVIIIIGIIMATHGKYKFTDEE